MLRVRSSALRVAALVLALAMLVVAAHTHSNDPPGRCDVCQTASHRVAHQTTAPVGIEPLSLHRRTAFEGSFGSYETLFSQILFTRGPPSFSAWPDLLQ
jgi:hypothetical protein